MPTSRSYYTCRLTTRSVCCADVQMKELALKVYVYIKRKRERVKNHNSTTTAAALFVGTAPSNVRIFKRHYKSNQPYGIESGARRWREMGDAYICIGRRPADVPRFGYCCIRDSTARRIRFSFALLLLLFVSLGKYRKEKLKIGI